MTFVKHLFRSLLPLLLLSACTSAAATITPEPSKITPTQLPEEQHDDNPNSTFTLADLQALSPSTILVQQDYEPGFSMFELHFDFGRVPPFTLYADGTLIYVEQGRTYDEQQVMQAALTPDETVTLVQKVLDAGFERLESYTDFCQDQGDGTELCIADASTSVLRLRLSGEELREIKIYAEFANHPDVLENINALFSGYKHPAARPYTPSGATLFIQPLVEARDVTLQPWPLDADWLSRLDFGERVAVAVPLTGENLARYLAAVSRNSGDSFFTLDDEDYRAFLVPWLPGVDFTAAIQREFPIPELTTAVPTRFTGCREIEPALMGTLRLVWVEARDLWVWDRGEGEPYSLTGSGDVTEVRLTSDGETALFTRQVGSNSELWAVSADGTNLRQLAGGPQLSGTMHMLSFSFDESMLAFVHLLNEQGGELWVARLDGSGAQRLVSRDDLMDIIAEPLADFATPTGVTWIPNTYTLTYDAYPGFKNGGIYIYVQRQVWVVDAMSGAQGVLFPQAEGGQVEYSPDGTTMAIITPDSLRLMNIEAKDLHPAGVDYHAVGFGEYYAHPPLAWTPDSQALLVAQPSEDGINQDGLVTIWRVPVDGSAVSRVAEFSGFFPTVAFSPDRSKVAYWRAVAPGSNTRELRFVTLDSSEHIVYDTAEQLDFLSWAPDSQRFVYTRDQSPGNARLASICGDPVALGLQFWPANVTWVHPTRFLFEHKDEQAFQLYMGMVEDPGSPVLLLNLESFGGYDYAVLPGN